MSEKRRVNAMAMTAEEVAKTLGIPRDWQEEDLAETEAPGQRGAPLTEQLLAFSRQRPMRPTVANLNTVIEGAIKMLKRAIGEDIELEFHPHPDLGGVRVVAWQMEGILMNLALDARDAMPEGGKLLIETEPVTVDEDFAERPVDLHEGPYVRLSVTDTGCGMDPDTMEPLFEPFFTTKEPGKGTGLGLATVYGIVAQHEGAISVYSEPDKGTTFKVYLPRVREQPAPDVASPDHRSAPRGSQTVLVVEDEEAVRSLAERILTRQGYTVLSARDPGEGAQVFRAHADQIDLLLTDVVMPGGDGNELFEELSAEKPSLKVLYVSGYASSTVMQRGLQGLDTAFMMKPFDAQELARHVRRALDAEGGRD
ncbi:MAG: response regulator [Candidatus Brocadiia bacterium]